MRETWRSDDQAEAPPLPAALVSRGRKNLVRREKDRSGQKLGYVYFEEEPGRRSASKLLTKDEARRIAANVAKLPENRAITGENHARGIALASSAIPGLFGQLF